MTDSNVTAAALTRIIANLVSEDGDGDDDDNDGDYYTVNILLRHKDHAQNIKTHGNSNNSNRYNNVTETRKSIIALRIKRLLRKITKPNTTNNNKNNNHHNDNNNNNTSSNNNNNSNSNSDNNENTTTTNNNNENNVNNNSNNTNNNNSTS